MALQKQPISLNFAQGLDLKTDSKQVQLGKFLALQNSIFDKGGRLTKRNGFASVTTLPDTNQTTLTSLNNSLVATGSSLYSYSEDINQWFNRGTIQPVDLNTLPLVRNSTSQTAPDACFAPSGLVCLVYEDTGVAYYQISDSSTGQQVISRTALPSTASKPRVVLFNGYFVITYLINPINSQMQYITIPVSNPSIATAPQTLANTVNGISAGYDVITTPAGMFYAYAESATVFNVALLTIVNIALNQIPTAVAVVGSHTATAVSLALDLAGLSGAPLIWVTFYNSTSATGYTCSFDNQLNLHNAPFLVITTTPPVIVTTITSSAANEQLTIFCELSSTYPSAMGSAPTHHINKIKVAQNLTTTTTTLLRSVGLASKAFTDAAGSIYVLAAYQSSNNNQDSNQYLSSGQNTYFLIDSNGSVLMRLAYSNGGGYASTQVLPTVSVVDNVFCVPYRITDFLATVNKTVNTALPANAIYTQTGINLAKFSINTSNQYSSEIAGALHLTGGQLWEYDGVKPVEHNFHVWPDTIGVSTVTGPGDIASGTYFYSFTYEWTDNQGNLHRSAPSIPIKIVTSTAHSTNTLYVPTLRLTAKSSPNPVRIVGYRWSTIQPVSYQFTSLTSPIINDPTVDYITITDTLADSFILGNTLLYTTGGVVENIAAPASVSSAMFKNRLFLIDAEDRNLLWFSKQVIEATPVEMSDLFTLYVSPTTGAQGSTGPMTALSAMDDKLIIFKKDAIYYMTGTGPDNTGANNDFSDPIYITASVGCTNPNSIVLMPNGIMFQSDKGIWLLGRDLQTNYIGAPVEDYNSSIVESATAIPGTNQVRFILDSGITLMYDYFFNQWGTFSNISAISATLWQGKHTYLNSLGSVFQEKPGTYLDGSVPVLLSLSTSWITLSGIQGLERFYFLDLLGSYVTPFKLQVQLAYDYSAGTSQSVMVLPNNYTPNWGGEAQWGSGGPWGGNGNVFEARVYPTQQKCESFQIRINEIYDPSYGVAAGEGLTLSGINLIVGTKKGYRSGSANKAFG